MNLFHWLGNILEVFYKFERIESIKNSLKEVGVIYLLSYTVVLHNRLAPSEESCTPSHVSNVALHSTQVLRVAGMYKSGVYIITHYLATLS